MKLLLIILYASAVVFAQFNESRGPVSTNAKNLSTVSTSFTDKNNYNTFSHSANPIGIFETEDALLNFKVGHRYLGWNNSSNPDSSQLVNGFIIPQILVGAPDKIYLGLNYSINPTSRSNEFEKITMAYNSFGMFLIGQTEEGRLQFGVKGKGYYGNERTVLFDSSRTILGVDEVGVCLGSKLHEAVQINFYAHAAGFFDSLFTKDRYPDPTSNDSIQWPQERFAWLQLPQIDFSIDIGMKDFPYLSNFCFTYARNNFVYTLKANNVWLPNSNFHQIAGNNDAQWSDADPIVTDSIGWHWQNLWEIRINKTFGLNPALHLGYWHNRCKRMKPGTDNHPINYDGEKTGYTWENESFQFGIGNVFLLEKFAKIWFEYSRANLGLEITGNQIAADEPEKRGYNRIGTGFITQIDALPFINMPKSVELFFTFGFLFMQENALYSIYKFEPFRFMYNIGVETQLYRYQPWEEMKTELKTSNVSFGLGASFMNKMFEVGVHLGILRQEYTKVRDEKYKGLESGIDLKYNILSANKEKRGVEKKK